MAWLQLKFNAPSALAEALADRLTDAGALAVALRDSTVGRIRRKP